MALSKHLLIVSATVAPEVEAEWNKWYNDVHLPEIRDCPGFLSGQRFVTAGADGARRYVAIYEVDGSAGFPELGRQLGVSTFSGRGRDAAFALKSHRHVDVKVLRIEREVAVIGSRLRVEARVGEQAGGDKSG